MARMATQDYTINDDSEIEAEARFIARDLESDDESLEGDSPADGYFDQRDHPRQTFAERSGIAQAKAQEAAESVDSRRSAGEVRHTSQLNTYPALWASEDPAVVLDAGPAPPDYAAATADRRAEFGIDHPLVRNGLFGDRGILNSGRQQPQSMMDPSFTRAHETIDLRGGGVDDVEHFGERQPNEQTGLVSGRQRDGYERRKGTGRFFKKSRLFQCVIVLITVFALVVLLFTLTRTLKRLGHVPDNGGDQPQLPVTQPPSALFPSTPGCSQNDWAYSMVFDFEATDKFYFREFIESYDFIDQVPAGIAVSGKISIGGPHSEQESDISLGVNVITSVGLNITNYNYLEDKQGLEFHFPGIEWTGEASKEPCMQFYVHVAIKPGVEIGNLFIDTYNLAVIVEPWHKEMDIKIVNETSIFAASGHVNLASWESRTTIIETQSGHIGGTYGLRDLLKVKSQSGSIDIDVDPKEADKEHPAPAEFIAQSSSGSVRATFPTSELGYDIPERDYITRVETQSSSISGTYIHGLSSSFTCNSGGMDVELLPYDSGKKNKKSTLRTENSSGHTSIEILPPYVSDSDASSSRNQSNADSSRHSSGKLDLMSSRHKSSSGSVQLTYPDEWEGKIDLQSSSGGVKLRGKDIEMFEGEIPEFVRKLVGWKGNGDSKLNVRTVSGSINVLVGDE